ncbi:hypothetical protein TNCV_1232721 [Trichonephila clavipes]|nr:hypothetical protein TNCV_1232721 [Trichonephila clavipes]
MPTHSNLGPCLEKQGTSQLKETSPLIWVCESRRRQLLTGESNLYLMHSNLGVLIDPRKKEPSRLDPVTDPITRLYRKRQF